MPNEANIIEFPIPFEQVQTNQVEQVQAQRAFMLPPDTYDLQVTNIVLKTARNDKNFILITYRVTSGNHAAVRDAIFPHSEKLGALILATGINITTSELGSILKCNEFTEATVDILHRLMKRRFRGYVTTDERVLPDGVVRVFNKVSAYMPLEEEREEAESGEIQGSKRCRKAKKKKAMRGKEHVRTMEQSDFVDLVNDDEA